VPMLPSHRPGGSGAERGRAVRCGDPPAWTLLAKAATWCPSMLLMRACVEMGR